MSFRSRPALAVLAVAVLALAGGGAAFAVTKSRGNQSQGTGTTQQQGNQNQNQDRRCGPGFFGRGSPGPAGFMSAAASYLGLTNAQLASKLQSGQTLAEVAKAQGKSVDGLKAAMVKQASDRLQQAVDDGNLTEQQKTQLLQELQSHLDDIVNGTLPKLRFGHGPPMGAPGWGPRPPDFSGPPSSSGNDASYGPGAAGTWA
jgi:hypothetical protein